MESADAAAFVDEHLLHPDARADANIERLDAPLEDAAAVVVELHRHEARRHLDHGRVEAEEPEGVGRLESEQAAADDCAGAAAGRPLRDRVEIVERPVHEHTRRIDTAHGRNERRRTGREHAGVERDAVAARGGHFVFVSVEARSTRSPVRSVTFGWSYRSSAPSVSASGSTPSNTRRQVHAVVGPPVLLAEHDQLMVLEEPAFDRGLHEVVTDHAVADHEDAPGRGGAGHVRPPPGDGDCGAGTPPR